MEAVLSRIRTRAIPAISWVFIGVSALVLGFTLDGIGLKAVAFVFMALMAVALALLPYAWAISLFFFYLGFEGMLKLLTNYNPAIHIGADLLLGLLCTKWFLTFLLQRVRLPEKYPPLMWLFAAHFIWFLIEFANPYSIGLIPSLAATKLYVSMVILYFFGFYLAGDRKNHHLFIWPWILILGVQVVTGLYQASAEPASVLALSPAYGRVLAKYGSFAFRPFGTTSQAGGPAILIFLAVPLLLYMVVQSRPILVRLAMVGLLPLATTLLMFCQVRSALMKSIIGAVLFFLFVIQRSSRETRMRLMLGAPVVVVVMFFALPQLTDRWVEDNSANQAAVERSMSLFDYNVVKSGREGALDRILNYAEQVPLGAGHARTGPAAGKFWNEMQDSGFFTYGFFGDNFWATTIAELGIIGSGILTALILGNLILGFLGLRRMSDPSLAPLQSALLAGMIAIVIGLWGAEGILYTPEAPYFWFFGGMLMRLPALEPVHTPVV